jgi:Flp pilus assembly protein TadG
VRLRWRRGAQSTIEFALLLPTILLGLMVLIGIGLVTRADAAVAAVAAEAARAGALAATPDAASEAARTRAYAVAADYELVPDRLDPRPDTSDFRRGGEVRVDVDYTLVIGDLPLVGWGSVPLHHQAIEPVDTYRTQR